MHRTTSHTAAPGGPGDISPAPRPADCPTHRLAASGIPALLVCLLLACIASTAQANGAPDTVEHIVIVWLKSPGNAEHRRRIITESAVLRDIPGVSGLRAGEVVAGERDIVDSSFDVALIVSFTDQAAMQAYLTHPVHVELVEQTLKPLVEKLRVYDFR